MLMMIPFKMILHQLPLEFPYSFQSCALLSILVMFALCVIIEDWTGHYIEISG